MDPDYYNIQGFYMSNESIKQIDDLLYAMAGVINIRTYFSKNKARVSANDPGAIASNIILNQLLDNINQIYRSVDSKDFDSSVDDYRILHLAVSPDIKYLLNDKFEAVKTLEDSDKQTTQTLIFKKSIEEDIYEVRHIT